MPQQHQLHINGIEMSVYEWGQPRAGQAPVLFAHAAGFHARIWDQVIANLPGFHCFAVDLRGHGHSLQADPVQSWRIFAEDLVAIGGAQALQGAVGVGHSLGGHAVTLAAALQPTLFSQLVLIDPVIMPHASYTGASNIGQFTAKRRNQWQSADEMYERFKDRPPFNLWQSQVLRDYVDHALRPAPNGEGFVLACTPEFEAATYNLGTAANIYPEIASIQIPVTILRAYEPASADELDFNASPTAPNLATQFLVATDIYLNDYTHFMPMQVPELTAQIIRNVATPA